MHDTAGGGGGSMPPWGAEELTALVQDSRRTGRRMFLKWVGVSIAGVALAACSDTTAPAATTPSDPSNPNGSGQQPSAPGGVDLGSGDVGILNYAFALEQVESAFYTNVINHPYGGMTAAEHSILDDIRKHENIHAKFFAAALGSNGIPYLNVSFSSVDFTSRSSVLATAKAFEDTGVSAYNGAGQLLQSSAYLLLAGKIVSVEARHAAAIRDLLNPRSMDFAGDDVVSPTTGLDVVRTPAEVLAIVAPTYVKTAVNASHLPTAPAAA